MVLIMLLQTVPVCVIMFMSATWQRHMFWHSSICWLEERARVYNLGSENGFSVREIIDAAKKITGIDFTVVEESRRSGDPAVLIASSEKIRDELGWVPKCSTVNEVISTAWKWHKGHPQGYEG